MADDSPDLVLASVMRTIATLDQSRQDGIRACAAVLRSVVRTANKAGAAGDLALMLVCAERSKGPID